MKWSELKKLIDDTIIEETGDMDCNVWYIDVSFPDPDRMSIFVDHRLGLAVNK